jgi:hypothetical protein
MDEQQKYRQNLARQLAWTKETWSRLVDHGLTPSTEVELDFTFATSDRQKATDLAEYLREETDYEVGTVSSGGFLSKTWFVKGKTQPTRISLEVLEQWVAWMVAAGQDHDCMFDGWGTSV